MKKSTVYRIPNSKKWLLTDAFLKTFKEELDVIFKVNDKEENPTYWNTYIWLEGTAGFYKALRIVSEKYNVRKAIYDYANRMQWYNSDTFDAELTVLMYKKNIITEGSIDDIDCELSDEQLAEMEERGEIIWEEEISYYNGYHVIRRDWIPVK